MNESSARNAGKSSKTTKAAKFGTKKTTNKADLLIVIPLREELQNVLQSFGDKWEPRLIGSEVYHFGAMGNEIRVAIIRLREMGNQPALEQTTSAIGIVSPNAVFCIGLGGSLHNNDLKLGDVAISRAVAEIADAAKVSSTVSEDSKSRQEENLKVTEAAVAKGGTSPGENSETSTAKEEQTITGYFLELMSRQFEASIKLVNIICNLPEIAPDLFKSWQDGCTKAKSEEMAGAEAGSEEIKQQRKDQSRDKQEFDDCHFASGLVVASSNLKLRVANREYKVIETEGAGVARACVHRESPVPFVIFRGICDLANEQKGGVETGAKIWPPLMWRRLGAKNAALFLKTVLQLPMMRAALRSRDLVDLPDIRAKVSELEQRGKLTFESVDLLQVLPLMSGILAQAEKPCDLFISAGDLWIGRPLLTHRQPDRHTWYPIKDIYIVTIKPDLVASLRKQGLIADTTIQALIPNIEALNDYLKMPTTNQSGRKCRIFHACWPALPRFHGYVFSDYVWFGRWGAGDDGKLQMLHEGITIIRKDAFPEIFDSVERLLPQKGDFREVDESYIKTLAKDYGAFS